MLGVVAHACDKWGRNAYLPTYCCVQVMKKIVMAITSQILLRTETLYPFCTSVFSSVDWGPHSGIYRMT